MDVDIWPAMTGHVDKMVAWADDQPPELTGMKNPATTFSRTDLQISTTGASTSQPETILRPKRSL